MQLSGNDIQWLFLLLPQWNVLTDSHCSWTAAATDFWIMGKAECTLGSVTCMSRWATGWA